MDEMVLEVQRWLNRTYTGENGYSPIPEDGATGGTTVGALIIGLQIELGIADPVPSFGPATESLFPGLSRQEDGAKPNNLIKILQGGFWCKGYNPGGFSGNFFGDTETRVRAFESDVGLDPTGYVDSKLMKAILNTDGFVLSSIGRQNIREIQQSLNRDYGNYFDYIPTNGIYERNSNRALIYALQHEIGIGHIANGHFGPSTQENCPSLSYHNAAANHTKILQWALACNSPLYDTHPYNGEFDIQVETAVNLFKEFMTLPTNGIADMPTINQLLTSNGYTGRPAIACDASTVITQTTADTLVANNYQIIGRYLTGYVGTGAARRSKAMTAEELDILSSNGIRVFPIYQDGGYYHEYFVPGRGTEDARDAVRAAHRLGYPSGTTIYFAVDYDALDYQVTNNILPYLAEVRSVLDAINESEGSDLPEYKLGVYGSRNTCIRAQGDSRINADFSFVGNMSTGFSGNLGFPMPMNWSYNQFYETSIGSGSGALGIDKNDYSGRDPGVTRVTPPDLPEIDEEYKAKYNAFKRIGENIPGLQHFAPELFAMDIDFSKSYRVARIPNVLTANVEFSETLHYPGDASVAVLQVTPDGVSGSLEGLLGETIGRFTQERLGFYEDFIDDLAASIGTGAIQFSMKGMGTGAELRITAFDEEIPTEGGGTLQLAVTLVITVDLDLTPLRDVFPTEEALLIAATLGILFIIVLAALYGAGAIAILSTATLIALLIGDVDDIDDGTT